MYLPKHFLVIDSEQTVKIMQDFPFATLISCVENQPFVSHLPLLFQEKTGSILGHMARGNPHWRLFIKNSQVTVLFHGPHTYITPTWYVSEKEVPTWNYAVVHVTGKVRLIEDYQGITGILKDLTQKFEISNPNPWQFDLPEDLTDPIALTSAIVGFEIEIENLQAKFKLSQNRKKADRLGVIQGLQGRTDEMSQQVRKMMVENGD